MNILARSHLLIAFVSVFCGCQSPPDKTGRASIPTTINTAPHSIQTATSGETHAIPEPLVLLNKLFLAGYEDRQAIVKTNINPLIVANFSTLILYWNGVAETNKCIPDIYRSLKNIAHVPLGIYLQVEPYAGEFKIDVPETILAQLKTYHTLISETELALPQAGFSPSQLHRQQEMLTGCKAYLTSIVDHKHTSRKDLLAFTHSLAPLILANADDAAIAQLNMTHATVMQWKRKIPQADWNRLVVVVRGFQMPRRLNIFTQYFAKVLREHSPNLGYPLESRRLIYAEFIMTNKDHLDLMATTFIDGDASEAFFGDRWRMSRDILADGAKKHLNHLRFE